MLSTTAIAAEYGQRRRQNGKSKKEERQEELRAAAMEDFKALDTVLKEMLKIVAVNERPETAQIENAAALLESNKRNAQVLDGKEKAQFMLLQAWTGYLQGNAPIAFNWSTKAFKTDTKNTDAWISHGIFSMLNGKQPMRMPRPKPEKKRRTAGDYGYGNRRDRDTEHQPMAMEHAMTGMSSSSASVNGILQFDMTTVRRDMFREEFSRFEYLAADGTQVQYKPGRDTLCVLFWQSEEAPVDPNTLAGDEAIQARKDQKKKKEQLEVPEPLKIEKQRGYFKKLYEACKDDETVKFVQINTVQPINLQAFMQSMPDYTKYPYPTVIAAAEESGARAIVGTDARIPFMLIADKTGSVIYAGPAKEFVPAFILTETTGIPIDLKDEIKLTQKNRASEMMMDPMMLRMMGTLKPKPEPKADPNQPAIDPNAITQMLPKTGPQGKTYKQLPLEQSYQAGKDLEYANMFIDAARKRAQTYKKGVEMCRKIIKSYPDTIYEQQARMLLRQVPEYKRSTYSITDEELGL
jgi:hypothetical protein